MSTSAKPVENGPLRIRRCGLIDFDTCLDLQFELRDRRRSGEISDTVLIVEHPPVITLGARNSANRLTVDQDVLRDRGIETVPIRRGGGATAHNPGQIVFYPILDLNKRALSANTYVRTLEQIGIDLLAELGVTAQRSKGYPGLWVPDSQDQDESQPDPNQNQSSDTRNTKKIASIGVRVSRFITCHGMAINICNDLSIFDLMVPCGLDNVRMTSVLQETGRTHDMAAITQLLEPILLQHLTCES